MNENNYKICHECGSKMLPCIITKTFRCNGKDVEVQDINAYKCVQCGEVVFTADELARIERAFQEQSKTLNK